MGIPEFWVSAFPNLVLGVLFPGFSRPTSKATEKRPGDEVAYSQNPSDMGILF